MEKGLKQLLGEHPRGDSSLALSLYLCLCVTCAETQVLTWLPSPCLSQEGLGKRFSQDRSSCLFKSNWALDSQIKGIVPLIQGSMRLKFQATISGSLKSMRILTRTGEEEKDFQNCLWSLSKILMLVLSTHPNPLVCQSWQWGRVSTM